MVYCTHSGRHTGDFFGQADALRLPFDDQRFDLIICQFGVMFFPDRPAAFREMRRVLAPAGRLLFSTWGAVETHGFAAAMVAALGHVFPDDPPAFVAAVPHGYCDLGQVAADLADVYVRTPAEGEKAPSWWSWFRPSRW